MCDGGGAAFFPTNALERSYRDAQGARYHPLQEGQQKDFSSRIVLDMEV
ncbi:MAG: hypothetical protein IT531_08105 [Burkholderiales bacterium]|nr:hypothetical protein [Burkholderiales bacterium]